MTGLMSGCWAGVGRVTVSIWAGSLDPLWPFSGDWEDMKTQSGEGVEGPRSPGDMAGVQ